MQPRISLLAATLPALLVLAGCVSSQPREPVAELPARGAVMIRIRNLSNRDFDEVTVGFPEQTESWGALAAGAATAYRAVSIAYRYAYIDARRGPERYLLQPIDYVGERALPPGRYTYELRGRFGDGAGGGNLRMTLRVDRNKE